MNQHDTGNSGYPLGAALADHDERVELRKDTLAEAAFMAAEDAAHAAASRMRSALIAAGTEVYGTVNLTTEAERTTYRNLMKARFSTVIQQALEGI